MAAVPSSAPAIRVEGVVKRFGGTPALAGVDLEIPVGTVFGLLGPNGAGKTTLIRAIAGRLRLDGGEIRMFDRALDGRRTPPELGMVPQEIAVYPMLTARENLEFTAQVRGMRSADAKSRVDSLLERFGMAHNHRDAPVAAFAHFDPHRN